MRTYEAAVSPNLTPISDASKGGGILIGNFLYNRECFLIFDGGKNRHPGFDDAGFFAGDFGEGVAEPFLVVVLDVGDDAGEGGDDVGGVEAAAEAGFPNDDVAFLFGEPNEGHDGDDFEEGGVIAFGKLGEEFAHEGDEAGDFGFGDELAIDLDAFGEGDEVRRGVEAGFVAGVAVDRFEHGAGGAFAIGAGDVDEFEFVLRVANSACEQEGAFEAGLGAELLELVEEFDCFGVGHFGRHSRACETNEQRWVVLKRDASLDGASSGTGEAPVLPVFL